MKTNIEHCLFLSNVWCFGGHQITQGDNAGSRIKFPHLDNQHIRVIRKRL